MAETQTIYNGLQAPAYLQQGNIVLEVQTAVTQGSLGNSVIGNPSDGSYAGGAVTVTPTTLIADAFDRLNMKLAEQAEAIDLLNARIDGIMAGSGPSLSAHCDPGVTVGMVVHVSYDGTDAVAEAADPATLYDLPATGIVLSKPSPTSAIVSLNGLIPDMYTGLIPGAVYAAGPGGTLAALPLNLTGTYYVQPLGVATSPTSFALTLQPVRSRLTT